MTDPRLPRVLLAITALTQGLQYLLRPDRPANSLAYRAAFGMGAEGWATVGALLMLAGALMLVHEVRIVGYLLGAATYVFLAMIQLLSEYYPAVIVLPLGLLLAEVHRARKGK